MNLPGGGLMEKDLRWMVVFKRDAEPVEVYSFEEESEARELYDNFSLNWTECYLCKVVEPLRN